MSTATTSPSATPATARSGVRRGELYAAVMAVLLVNAVAWKLIDTVQAQGPLTAFTNGLGMSWAFWFACAAAVRLALTEAPAPLRPRDLWLAGASLAAAIAPSSPLAAFVCSALAAAILFDRDQGPRLKAAAWVLGAISVQVLWARVLMLFFIRPIAALDARMVGAITGRPVHGNNVLFADGSHEMSILAACTSVENASVALMLFVAIVRSFRPQPKRAELYGLAGVFLSVVAVNIVRLGLMAQNITMFHLVHDQLGAGLVNAVITAIGLAWAAGSVRREIFR